RGTARVRLFGSPHPVRHHARGAPGPDGGSRGGRVRHPCGLDPGALTDPAAPGRDSSCTGPPRGSYARSSTASPPAIPDRCLIAAAMFLATVLAASLLPALRASRVAPVEALREE